MTVSRRLLQALHAALACAVLLSGAACTTFSSDAPPVADSTLVNALTELHLATERVEVDSTFAPGGRDSILARHGLTADDLDAVFAYYSHHPDAYHELYDAVVDSLSAFRSRLETGPITHPHRRAAADSVAATPDSETPDSETPATPDTPSPSP